MASAFVVVQSTDNVTLDNVISGQYSRPGLEMDKPPTFSLMMQNFSGVDNQRMKAGKEVKIYRNGILEMDGIVETVTPEISSADSVVRIEGVSRGYKLLQGIMCDDYDYDEDNLTATTRDAVTINPWRYTTLRLPDGTPDTTTGLTPVVEGATFDDVVESLVGTKATFTLDFQDNTFLKPSTIDGSRFQVYQDKVAGDVRPYLQRVRNNDVSNPPFGSDTLPEISTIPFKSGDDNITVMGAIRAVSLVMIYTPGSAAEVITVADAAGGTIIDGNTPAISNYNGSGLSAKLGIINAAVRSNNEISLIVTSSATGTVSTPTKIHYMKLVAHTTSDTNLEYRRRLPDHLYSLAGTGEFEIANEKADTRVSVAFTTNSSAPTTCNKVQIRVRKSGSPTGNVTVRLSTSRTSGGETATFDIATLPTVIPALLNLSLSSSVVLEPDTTYYLTVEYTGGFSTDYLNWGYGGANQDSANEVRIHDGVTWEMDTENSAVLPFVKIYYQSDDLESHLLDTDVNGFTRLDALERIRKISVSDTSVSVSPHFDMWTEPMVGSASGFILNWQERRGADITTHDYSFDNENIVMLKHEKFGKEIAYQTIALGAGSGEARTRIVSKTEFSLGGLYDVDRDPAVGSEHGYAARIMYFTDPNENSASTLLKKARAFHKLHRDPIENIDAEFVSESLAYFDVGDKVAVRNIITATSGSFRVAEMERSWDGRSRERVRVKLGERADQQADYVASSTQKADILTVRAAPRVIKTASTAATLFFDKTSYGVFSFNIDDGSRAIRVKLQLTTQPYIVPSGSSAVVTFKGDTPGANPVLGDKVQFYVDPTLVNALPSGATAFPANFGSQTTQQTIIVDITIYLSQESNKVIKSGQHQVYLLASGAGAANNTNGLSCVSAQVIIDTEAV